MKRSLFVVVADLDAEKVMGTLLTQRQSAIGIQLDFRTEPPPRGDMLRYSGRVSGCYKDAVDVLRSPQKTHNRAILIFDRHGCGVDANPREQIETELENALVQSGWRREDVAVIVLDPELEAWVWSPSIHVPINLGWQSDYSAMKTFLEKSNPWNDFDGKPSDPKRAMELAMREKRKPKGAKVFAQIAASVSLQGCQDAAFQKFITVLQRWFTPSSNDLENEDSI